MNYDYVIRLRRPDYRAIDLISQLLLVLFLAAAAQKIAGLRWQGSWQLKSVFPAMVLVLWILNLSRAKGAIVYYRLPLLLSGVGWAVVAGGWSWMMPLYILLGLLEPQIKFPDEIGFSKEKIVRNTFPRKTYQWIDIDSVMIRNNLFTLDLRSNKLIQKELETPVSIALQTEFNEYCRQQLHFINS